MSSAIAKLMEQIDSRVLRERVLIFITALALVYMVWSLLVQSGFDSERARQQTEETSLNQEQSELVAKISTLTTALQSDPAITKAQEVSKLNASISEVETKLAGLSQGLISAAQLPKALEEVLQRTKSVRLLQVRTLAATELQLATAKTEASVGSEPSAGSPGVYKHGVLIRVAGSYAQLIQLMTEIEALQYKFYWESLDYTVKQYPGAEIDIRVFTLSSEEGLLGV
ncbi:MAG: MSHA biogenesis protein MshJ [Cellvibrio sp.]|uniref:MSHA biogenesis protein MshJ n=1 Tax=Cellvibrio sp. TaxID=1965322 RepID=UPI0031A1149C